MSTQYDQISIEEGVSWSVAAALEDGSIALVNTARKLTAEDAKKPGKCDMKIVRSSHNNQRQRTQDPDRHRSSSSSLAAVVHPSNLGLVYARGFVWHASSCAVEVYNTSQSDRIRTSAVLAGAMNLYELGCDRRLGSSSASAFDLPAVVCSENSISCNSSLECRGFQCARSDAGPLFIATPPFLSTTRQSKGLLALLESLIPKAPVAVPNPYLTITVPATSINSDNGSTLHSTTIIVYHSNLSFDPQMSSMEMYANYSKIFIAVIVACALMWWKRFGSDSNRKSKASRGSSTGYGRGFDASTSPSERYESLHGNLRAGGSSQRFSPSSDAAHHQPNIGDIKKELSGMRSQLNQLRSR